jgi:hypothetical protein
MQETVQPASSVQAWKKRAETPGGNTAVVLRIFLVGFFCLAAAALCVVQPRGPLQAIAKPKPINPSKLNLKSPVRADSGVRVHK